MWAHATGEGVGEMVTSYSELIDLNRAMQFLISNRHRHRRPCIGYGRISGEDGL